MPLHIGYSNVVSPSLGLSAYAGPVLKLYQDYSGYNINTEDVIVQSDNIEGASLLSAFDVGLSVDYTLGRKVDLSFGAYYRNALSTFSIDGNVSQSYDNMNLQVGILYNFY